MRFRISCLGVQWKWQCIRDINRGGGTSLLARQLRLAITTSFTANDNYLNHTHRIAFTTPNLEFKAVNATINQRSLNPTPPNSLRCQGDTLCGSRGAYGTCRMCSCLRGVSFRGSGFELTQTDPGMHALYMVYVATRIGMYGGQS